MTKRKSLPLKYQNTRCPHLKTTKVGVGGGVENPWPQISETRACGHPSEALGSRLLAVAANGLGRQRGNPPASRSGSS